MPRNGARGDSDSTDDSFRTNRRTYLKAAGASVVSVPLLAGEGAAATERHGISFDTVVDMVDDAGCDPTGSEPCDSNLRQAAGSNTLLRFPSGTYKFTEKNALNGYSNFGILGEGDATFTVPDDFNEKLVTINFGTGALLENITVDQSNATPCMQVAPNDNLEVHGLTMVGQGISSATGENAQNAFNPMVRSSGGEGMVENVSLHNAGPMGAYARVGVWIGSSNEGTITLRNCTVEGFSNNGVYASRTPGVVQVEGGTFRNNDLSQVRIGSTGSYVDGATVETDVSESDSPTPDGFLNGSGIRIEKPEGGSGAEIRNCDIRIGPDVNAQGGIQVFSNYGAFSIENTRVEFNPDGGYAIRGKSPNGVSGDTSAALRNVSVTGESSNWVGVLIEDRPNTVVANCCIHQPGTGRAGLGLYNCDSSRVVDCTINASAQALRIRNCDVVVSNIEESGTCPAPNLGSSGYTGSSSDEASDESSADESSSSESSSGESSSDESASNGDSSSEESSGSSDSSSDESSSDDSAANNDSSDGESSDSSESSSDGNSSDESSSGNADGAGSDDELSGNIEESDVPEPPEDADLVITDTDTSGDRIPYEITTSGDIDHATAYGAAVDSNDPISGTTATGGVNEWRDAYSYEGEIVSLEIGERAVIRLDRSAGTITVDGRVDADTEYSIEVSGTLEHADDSGDPISEDGSRVEGGVGTFRDTYNYTGRLIQASIENGVSITTRPETLDE